jgi:Uma2 family endonuclease
LVEVLSPSNRDHDLLTKKALYDRAGVKEYWIVDPDDRSLEVLTFDDGPPQMVRTVSGVDAVSFPLLGTLFPLSAVFAGLDEIAS